MINKAVLLSQISLILFSTGFSQIRNISKEDYDIHRFNTKTIEIGPSKTTAEFLQISRIAIVDFRPDTITVGLEQKNYQKPHFLILKQGLVSEASVFIDRYARFKESDSLSVVMILKKFWLTGGLDQDDNDKRWNFTTDTTETISNLLTRMDFYLKKGSDYYILYRFDSTFTIYRNIPGSLAGDVIQSEFSSDNSEVSKRSSELIRQALIASLTKLKIMDTVLASTISARRKFTWEEVETYEKQSYSLPVLTDTVLIPGVYMSFNEFKNNDPSAKKYEIVRDKLSDLIYIVQSDGKQIPAKDAWGYCDGHRLYIRSRANYFMLQRRGNAFYIFGSKRFVRPSTNSYSSPYMFFNQRFLMELRPYQLDWDSGGLD